MKNPLALLALILTGACAAEAEEPYDPSAYYVYFLGGQSNMSGYGFNADLPTGYVDDLPAVPIFHGKTVEDGAEGGGAGVWSRLGSGHGTGFDVDGSTNQLTDRFGPELSFARTLIENGDGRRIALIKFSRGGTGLVDGVSGYGSWDPDYTAGNGRNQYDNALTTIANAMAAGDIDGDGGPDRLIPAGIIWMQGEADAYDSAEASSTYAENLERLMDLFRAAFRDNDLPVIIGRIKDRGDTPETRVMKYSPEVQRAQEAYAAGEPCAAIVTATDDFGFLPDGWHYRSEHYLTLGEAFAREALRLQTDCG